MAIIRILCPTVHDFSPKTISSNTTVHRKTTHCGTQANNADPDQGLHCLLTGCYIKFEKKNDVAFDENVFNEQ